jgi:hypothetical protein
VKDKRELLDLTKKSEDVELDTSKLRLRLGPSADKALKDDRFKVSRFSPVWTKNTLTDPG